MTYEAWRISFQSSEQAARAAYEIASRNKQDAERYRWLRVCDIDGDDAVLIRSEGGCDELKSGAELDAAIDTAMFSNDRR